jgi:hypothetical protein
MAIMSPHGRKGASGCFRTKYGSRSRLNGRSQADPVLGIWAAIRPPCNELGSATTTMTELDVVSVVEALRAAPYGTNGLTLYQ